MLVQRSCVFMARYRLVMTPFDHQCVAIPTPRSMESELQACSPAAAAALTRLADNTHGERPESEVTRLLLEHLSKVCDKVKESYLDASAASSYYRTRYARGAALCTKHATLCTKMTDAELTKWARDRCISISSPLQSRA